MGVLNGISLCKTRRMLKIALVVCVCAQNANLHQSTATYSTLESFFHSSALCFYPFVMPKENEWKRAENAENCILRTRLLFLLISYAFSRLLGIYRELIFHFEITLSKSMLSNPCENGKCFNF